MLFQIIRNDITKVKADAIVNTANPKPRIGRGTDSAIYAAASEQQLLEERKKIGEIAPGQAVSTDANARMTIVCFAFIVTRVLLVAVIGFHACTGHIEFVLGYGPNEKRVAGSGCCRANAAFHLEGAAFLDRIGLGHAFEAHSPSLEVLETDSVHCKFKPSFLFDDIHVDVRNRGKVYTSTYFVHIFQSSRIVTCLNACLSSKEQYVIVFEYRSI